MRHLLSYLLLLLPIFPLLTTSTLHAQGYAMYTQPPGLTPQPVPTSPSWPYYPFFANSGGGWPSYAASLSAFSGATSPSDIACLRGSDSGVIRVSQLTISGTQTVTGTATVSTVLRTTPNTGGTLGTAPTITRLDPTADPAPIGSIVTYTANPTLGTGIALVSRTLGLSALAGTPAGAVTMDWMRQGKPPTLRSSQQSFCINFGSTSLLGNSVNIALEWTEGLQ